MTDIPIGPDSFGMTKPCADCPFRRVGAIDLRPGRLRDIIAGLLSDDRATFVCHKTLDAGDKVQTCAGAMAYMLRIRRPSTALRLAVALHLVDPEQLRALEPDLIDTLENQ